MESAIRKMTAAEFAKRLFDYSKEEDKGFAFFLGAGCSVSSGIPTAGELVRKRWLPRLCEYRDAGDVDAWAREHISDYDPKAPAASYGVVMEKLFLQNLDRQREVETLCDNKAPGFGYGVLAALMANPKNGLNVAITTNFDDMVADALYLYTPARPLVINHEALGAFIRPTRTRPLVVKLHGDHRLAPRNTASEVEQLDEALKKSVSDLLRDRGLIFMGYGGHDKGIADMLKTLPTNSLPLGVYWIGSQTPDGEMGEWLQAKNAIWVEMKDFDRMMLLVRNAFDLPYPDEKRFAKVFGKYRETYDGLSKEINKQVDDSPDTRALKKAVLHTDKTFPHWYTVELAASRLKDSAPDDADAVYRNGLDQHPDSASLHGNYALFLQNIRKDYDRAEEHYRRALEIEPDHAINLGNFAIFLKDIRKDYDRAEEHYRRALEIEPDHANIMGNYANFIADIRKDNDRAAEFYRRALEIEPDDAINLGNFARLLLAQGRTPEGLAMLERAFNAPGFGEKLEIQAECRFYAYAHGPEAGRDEALTALKKLLSAGARSEGWDLSGNVERASLDGHPEAEWLGRLAAVIAAEAEIETLADWPRWRAALSSVK